MKLHSTFLAFASAKGSSTARSMSFLTIRTCRFVPIPGSQAGTRHTSKQERGESSIKSDHKWENVQNGNKSKRVAVRLPNCSDMCTTRSTSSTWASSAEVTLCPYMTSASVPATKLSSRKVVGHMHQKLTYLAILTHAHTRGTCPVCPVDASRTSLFGIGELLPRRMTKSQP